MRRLLFALLLLLSLAACAVPQAPPPSPARSPSTAHASELRDRAEAAVRRFAAVVETVEPVAERECRAIRPRGHCDFRIVVDDRPGQPPNAFQTLDRFGRPVIAFTVPLITAVENEDELAFIMSHEAAHHLLGHIDRTRASAATGALVFGQLVTLSGGDAETVRSAEEVGALLGARRFSKEFELEADALGTLIAARAGYDPVRGARFFERLPDPGNRFLGTHPPNAARLETVRRVAATLQ
ncbi:peptidase M48 [Rhodosalinus halophilus]|uniref:Peptidase M48 n=1 Tax=Rhodosalinus halophilus TaxID=2259333 RepID=A0A365U3W0_9RHOB|nr:M48 family metallopeptidase [Rhodosalinus halophilus]RBI82607.1 peptidase M48 [Rhodosalinus halophilus]